MKKKIINVLLEPLIYYSKFKDFVYRNLFKKEVKELHKRLYSTLKEQEENWPNYYSNGYFYQGFSEIGIHGQRPTEKRISNYGIINDLTKDQTVLDIGTNTGFLACYISKFVKEVDAIELNPYLIKIGEYTKEFLQYKNIKFINKDFVAFQTDTKYDIIFSLANHNTTDGNLDIDFEAYISKIYHLMQNKGYLFFETHDIHTDDRDLDEKYEIMNKYFELVFLKKVDDMYLDGVHRVFINMRKREKIEPDIKRTNRFKKVKNTFIVEGI